MRTRRLSPRTRSHCLACGLFLIGLSTTASLLSPAASPGEVPNLQNPPKAKATLAADVQTGTRRSVDCPARG
jgi:hypothetical protein